MFYLEFMRSVFNSVLPILSQVFTDQLLCSIPFPLEAVNTAVRTHYGRLKGAKSFYYFLPIMLLLLIFLFLYLFRDWPLPIQM